MMQKIYLIRHGATVANEQKLYCGRSDLPLSPGGLARLRQMAARGMAYRWAFLTLMLSLAVNTGVEAIWGPWAKPGVSAWMLIFLSIGVFIVACVRKDAYFAVAQNPRTYLWLFGAVVLCQIPNFLLQLRSGDLVEDGLLTWNALSPACGVLFGVMFVCMLVRLRRQKREEQEDAEA